jgi:hypothetical protein
MLHVHKNRDEGRLEWLNGWVESSTSPGLSNIGLEEPAEEKL